MQKKRFTEAQNVQIPGQATRGDRTIRGVCALHGVHGVSFYRWEKKYGDREVSEARRIRELESEDARLKRLLAERDLVIDEFTGEALAIE